ncbi:MAG: DUF2007 domain-containing protein [Dysgonamonadaceae bacterium]|nr:DUF2007 domain-containing protein [Dysgonamonadaceae bacterium]
MTLNTIEALFRKKIKMDEYITILTFTLPQDAYLPKALLESEGVKSILKDEHTVQVYNFYSSAVGGVKLQVKKSDVENGLDILEKGGYIKSESAEEKKVEIVHLNKETNKKECPFCQSDNIGKMKQANMLTVIAYFLLGAIFPIFKTSYTCFDCEKTWRFSRL